MFILDSTEILYLSETPQKHICYLQIPCTRDYSRKYGIYLIVLQLKKAYFEKVQAIKSSFFILQINTSSYMQCCKITSVVFESCSDVCIVCACVCVLKLECMYVCVMVFIVLLQCFTASVV